jgi:hypothetical protein
LSARVARESEDGNGTVVLGRATSEAPELAHRNGEGKGCGHSGGASDDGQIHPRQRAAARRRGGRACAGAGSRRVGSNVRTTNGKATRLCASTSSGDAREIERRRIERHDEPSPNVTADVPSGSMSSASTEREKCDRRAAPRRQPEPELDDHCGRRTSANCERRRSAERKHLAAADE